jgi:hypothetical protein
MIPVKWKIYRIMNYVLLIASAFIFLKFFEILIIGRYDLMGVLTILVLVFLILQSIINLAVMTKTFPGKLLTGAKSSWHVFATMINGFSFTAMAYGFFNMVSEITALDYSQYKRLIIMVVSIFILLLVIVLFIFICQLTLNSYLRRTHTALMNSMIDSIGTDK